MTNVSHQLTLVPNGQDVQEQSLPNYSQAAKSAGIDAKLHKRVLVRLDRLQIATKPEDMNLPGFNFHALRGFKPTRYSVHVNGPWCITLEFDGEDADRVDFEQYH